MQDLQKQLASIGLDKHRYRVFEDFVTLSAITLHNSGVAFCDKREQEYLKIIHTYDKADQKALSGCLAKLIQLLEYKPADVLGQLYMNMGFGDVHKGQFFTPDPISTFMAKALMGDVEKQLERKPFITLSEPACGAGGMVLAFVHEVMQLGYDPAKHLWVQATDMSRIASLMAYIQLSLWNVPAQVIVGNSLSLELTELWVTPAHVWFGWQRKLKQQSQWQEIKQLITSAHTEHPNTAKSNTQEVLFKKPKSVNTDAPPKTKSDVADAMQIAFDF